MNLQGFLPFFFFFDPLVHMMKGTLTPICYWADEMACRHLIPASVSCGNWGKLAVKWGMQSSSLCCGLSLLFMMSMLASQDRSSLEASCLGKCVPKQSLWGWRTGGLLSSLCPEQPPDSCPRSSPCLLLCTGCWYSGSSCLSSFPWSHFLNNSFSCLTDSINHPSLQSHGSDARMQGRSFLIV